MPDESYWESLFDVDHIVTALGIDSHFRSIAELGCGYGTFTLPVAQAVRGTLYTFDIDPAMVRRTKSRAAAAGIANVECQERDVMEQGFGLGPGSVDAVLLFNILHCDEPLTLFRKAIDVVCKDGWVMVIHWRYDATTPRGPALDIRPRPRQIIQWAKRAGLAAQGDVIDLPPWHYGLRLRCI